MASHLNRSRCSKEAADRDIVTNIDTLGSICWVSLVWISWQYFETFFLHLCMIFWAVELFIPKTLDIFLKPLLDLNTSDPFS